MFTTAMGALNGSNYLNAAFDTGWLPAEEEDSTSATLKKLETWTKSGLLAITITGDRTSRYKPGMKVKLDQDGVTKYFTILSVSYLNSYTNLTLDGYGIYTLSDSAITGCYYSILERPIAFPIGESAPKNRLINGSFDPAIGWQRGTSFTLNSAETKYTADRYRCIQGTGGVGTVSYQAVTPGDVPGAIGSLRWQQTTLASTAPEIMQPVESVYTFAGSVCTVSLWAKADTTRTIQLALRQNFGTGGTPSTPVDIAAQSFTIGTAWQRITTTFTVPSIAGKVLGTNGNDYLGVRIILPVEVTFDIQFTLCQLEAGNLATEFEWRTRQQEMALCQRFYEKSFALTTTPADGIGIASPGLLRLNPGGYYAFAMVFFTVPKRAIPTIVLYNPHSLQTNKIYNITTNSHLPGTVERISQLLCNIIVNNSATNVGDNLVTHWTADAEL